ncbi:hypothetical protein JCM14076_07750 [Methylosoma difficile]
MNQPAPKRPARKTVSGEPSATPAKPPRSKPKPLSEGGDPVKKPRKPRTTASKKSPPPKTTAAKASIRHKIMLASLETFGLAVSAVFAIVVLLGYSAGRFSGTNLVDSLLPFALGILVLVVVSALALIAWWKLRKWLQAFSHVIAPVLSVSLALTIGWLAMHDNFTYAFGQFRTLVGGKHEAERVTLTHQVFAAYRRQNPLNLQTLLNRSQMYNSAIAEAAKTFAVDANLLQGIAATESSFMPRDSNDGGHGLFQITLVPKAVLAQVAKTLAVNKPDFNNHRHNAYIAAATFKYYLAQMNNDLFLGLLAYNIGPTNGGLRFIMQQYGVTDFVTIQPYLQQLPRDYPIRVLTYALAFRLWQQEGKLLAYEEGKNALKIQRIGIPGL